MSLRNFAEPVMLVRSPTLTKFISGVSAKASRPDRRMNFGFSGIRRGGTSRMARPNSMMCSGRVPQQPPTMLTRPERANSPIIAPMLSGDSS